MTVITYLFPPGEGMVHYWPNLKSDIILAQQLKYRQKLKQFLFSFVILWSIINMGYLQSKMDVIISSILETLLTSRKESPQKKIFVLEHTSTDSYPTIYFRLGYFLVN